MLRDALALTEQGAKSLRRGAAVCALANVVLMLPVGVFYLVTGEFLAHLEDPATPLPLLAPYLVLIVAVLAVVFATQYWQYHATYSVVYQESARKRIGLAERLRVLPLSFFGKRDLADLTSVVMKDTADQERLFSHTMPQLFGTGASTAIVAVMLLAFDWRLALASLWPVPVAVIVLLATTRLQTAATRKKNAAALVLADGIQEYLESNREVRALNRTDDFLARLNGNVDAFERAKLASELTTGTAVSSTQTLLRLGTVTTILAGTALVAAGQCDLLVFFCFMLVVTRLYDPINLILQSTAELIDMRESLARMRAIEQEPAQVGSVDFAPQGHDIVFDGVSFSYENGEPVLTDVSFTAREGEVTALVGPSGSGKSTAAKLAARFWNVNAGHITVGGVDVAGVDPETLLTDYTEVFQDVVLFNGTVMENIRLGRRAATDEEVLAAARAANCDEFVRKMAQGYDTPIGENGALLSGGERQRISIARAILKDAPIVLLDEATASLDVESESLVQEALSRLLVGKTVLVIAHRMRTVLGADHIVVLADGRVAEEGAPAELLAASGLFARMVSLQGAAADWKL
ncbi:ABC transporter ATP-binding protein [Adlercreutzia rubneri]|uniref:ATP-binding cassette domain-containing protein n=1 Tax=Adlercreutzia rubneri TaxID=2916441 RepID=A0A7K1T4L3_9ACTN|nr:ABC transporter ATP-binding protein [Adlercreutzia rubneri]MCB6760739.1 ABC transporter ATP-binding protein/permease [Adlercreutzia equolifaciens]MDR3996115.1 ABC transporter ATP-binding protein [Adlercreutzia sp.]MCB6976570.1 ABC transporter ATP-binding protein/permease [Adlercreutzia equolifaciens]MDE8684551.1 ABC transporter ATP-binding protein [Adlercreutzia rubneri]MED9828365.1 ABC transporter ATP-binding protein [Adlercreutzia sp.]